MHRYFSREGIKECIDEINADPEHLKAAKLLTGKFILRILDAPDQKDVLVVYHFDKGRCLDWKYEDAPAPAPWRDHLFKPIKDGLARVTAKYDTLVQLDKGEIEVCDAVRSPDYKIEGSMIMLLPLMQSVDSWNRKIRSIPKTY